MADRDETRAILDLLQKKGYNRAALALAQDAGIESLLESGSASNAGAAALPPSKKIPGLGQDPQQIKETDANLNAYLDAYKSLRSWIESSIELYREELVALLFPTFVYIFLNNISKNKPDAARAFFDAFRSDHMEAHQQECNALAAIHDPAHIRDSETARQFLEHTYVISLSRTTHNLLMSFLQDKPILLLVANEHLNFRVVSEVPGTRPPLEGSGILGLTPGADLDNLNRQKVYLGAAYDERVLMAVEKKYKE
ncbi:Transcription initiation factor TFIID subunit 5, partial [Gonapodya sp. JEL0774]